MSISLSKRTRASLSKAFKVASKYLATCNTDCDVNEALYLNICACIAHAGRKGEITFRISYLAKDIVMSRLGDAVYFDGWLRKQVGTIAFQKDYVENNGRKKQDARRRWLQSLIKEFSQ